MRPYANPYRASTVATPTDYMAKSDHPHRFAQEVLLPIAAQRGRNAVLVDRVPANLYQRLLVGRICSCWANQSDEPRSDCLVCFGAGRVGGYNVAGTAVHILDVTAPKTVASNVALNHIARPSTFVLATGALQGKVITEFNLTDNLGLIDAFRVFDTTNDHAAVNVFVKTVHDANFVAATLPNLEDRLQSSPWTVMVRLSRDTLETESPILTSLYLRYRLSQHEFYVDIPRKQTSNLADELGLESLEQLQAWLPDEAGQPSTEDFWQDNRNNVRWKFINVNDNQPLGVNLGTDTTCRRIQSYEPYAQVP